MILSSQFGGGGGGLPLHTLAPLITNAVKLELDGATWLRTGNLETDTTDYADSTLDQSFPNVSSASMNFLMNPTGIVGGTPTAMAISPTEDKLYIAGDGNNLILYGFNLDTGAAAGNVILDTVPDGSIVSLAYTEEYVYLQTSARTIYEYTIAGEYVRTLLSGPATYDGSMHVYAGKLYVSNILGTTLYLYRADIANPDGFELVDAEYSIANLSNVAGTYGYKSIINCPRITTQIYKSYPLTITSRTLGLNAGGSMQLPVESYAMVAQAYDINRDVTYVLSTEEVYASDPGIVVIGAGVAQVLYTNYSGDSTPTLDQHLALHVRIK